MRNELTLGFICETNKYELDYWLTIQKITAEAYFFDDRRRQNIHRGGTGRSVWLLLLLFGRICF